MGPSTNYSQASVALARLLNQDSIPTSEAGRVSFFIASGVQRILRAFDFVQQQQFASLTTDVNGRVSLSSLRLGIAPGIFLVTNGTTDFDQKWPSDRYHYSAGDFAYNVVLESGVWVLYSSEANATITLGYYDTPDNFDSANPNVTVALQPMVIAKAALIYYRQAQDPEADTEQEEDQFRQEIAEITEAQERRRPQRFAQTVRDQRGHYLGYTSGGRRR